MKIHCNIVAPLLLALHSDLKLKHETTF